MIDYQVVSSFKAYINGIEYTCSRQYEVSKFILLTVGDKLKSINDTEIKSILSIIQLLYYKYDIHLEDIEIAFLQALDTHNNVSDILSDVKTALV